MADEFPPGLGHTPGVTITLDASRLLLNFKTVKTRLDVAALIQPFRLTLEDQNDPPKAEPKNQSPADALVNHTPFRFWVITTDGRLLHASDLNQIRSAFSGDLVWIGPVYRVPGIQGRGGLFCPVPDVLLVWYATDDANNVTNIGSLLGQMGMLEIPEKSRYLKPYHYYQTTTPEVHSAYDSRDRLQADATLAVREAIFANMPMLRPLSKVPSDTLYPQQWNMTQIRAGGAGTSGWDLSTGNPATVIAILDMGCDLTHPDLAFATAGINLGLTGANGGPVGSNPHGTCCAGIAAARFDNARGVAGVAGNCSILPLAALNGIDAEVAEGINFAADNGATVISMSFGAEISPGTWNPAVMDPAIAHAHNDCNVLLCAAAGNNGLTSNDYPARHPLVMAIGASDQSDERKTPYSPDGEQWASNYGADVYLGQTTGISVMAPGVRVPTTDLAGNQGFTATDYYSYFNGTSAATPHVAGLAAAVRSLHSALTNVDVRNIIERTADRVGSTPYAEVTGFPNGPRNQQMGYGRINMYSALDFADVLVCSFPGDTGEEPAMPPGGDFWDFSDIVVRTADDGVFVPADPLQASLVTRGQAGVAYVRVTNNGPQVARNVVVTCRLLPYAGLEFLYPDDWALADATHLCPIPVIYQFATIPAKSTALAKFTVPAAQVETAWNWSAKTAWHPCILAAVTSDNDYAFQCVLDAGLPLAERKNNLAQRNVTVIEVEPLQVIRWVCVAGHAKNRDNHLDLVINCAEGLTRHPVEIEFSPADGPRIPGQLGARPVKITGIEGGRIDDASPSVGVLQSGARVSIEKEPGRCYPMALQVAIPENAEPDQRFRISVSQFNAAGTLAGGASVLLVVRRSGTSS